jgi:hypothetical protein
MKVWITKYALTQGILEREADPLNPEYPNMIRVKNGISFAHYHGKDWHPTLEEARCRVRLMLAKKRASLEHQLSQLDRLRTKALTVKT